MEGELKISIDELGTSTGEHGAKELGICISKLEGRTQRFHQPHHPSSLFFVKKKNRKYPTTSSASKFSSSRSAGAYISTPTRRYSITITMVVSTRKSASSPRELGMTGVRTRSTSPPCCKLTTVASHLTHVPNCKLILVAASLPTSKLETTTKAETRSMPPPRCDLTMISTPRRVHTPC